MRLLLIVLLFSSAFATTARAQPVHVGFDAGLFFRGEAGGNHSVLPTFAPRLSLDLPHGLSAVVLSPFAYAPKSEGAGGVSTFHHRLIARAEYAYPVGSARFFAGLGVATVFAHTQLWEGTEVLNASMTFRVGPAIAAGIDVDVLPWRLRFAAETVFAAGRRDLSLVVGTTFPFGESR